LYKLLLLRDCLGHSVITTSYVLIYLKYLTKEVLGVLDQEVPKDVQ
jgi:hypothetical protein